jgi:hypothetical protein
LYFYLPKSWEIIGTYLSHLVGGTLLWKHWKIPTEWEDLNFYSFACFVFLFLYKWVDHFCIIYLITH